MNDDIKVNDGKGLYDNIGLIDSLIFDCNNATKSLIEGQFVQYCSINVQMVQKLTNLKKGIHEDMEALKNEIAELRALLNEDGGIEDDSGSVRDALDRTVGGREERLRDVIAATRGRLDSDTSDSGT